MSRYKEKKRRGHGCVGFFLTLFIISAVIVVLLAFSTHLLDGYKNKVYEKFYPREYSEYVEKYSKEFDVEEALVYAVIRTESGFRPEVESSAGAVGLMQLMPSTFEWLQGKLSDSSDIDSSALKDPETNIRYGTYLLSILLDRYENEQTAVAAYNAGITNVDNWLEDSAYSKDGKKLIAAEFRETEQYIDKVEDTKAMYEKLYYGKNN